MTSPATLKPIAQRRKPIKDDRGARKKDKFLETTHVSVVSDSWNDLSEDTLERDDCHGSWLARRILKDFRQHHPPDRMLFLGSKGATIEVSWGKRRGTLQL